MKLTIFFTTVLFLHVSASGVSQKVSISGKNIPLEKVFKEIKKQAGYIIFYDYDMVQSTKPVSMDLKNESVENILNVAFKGQGLTWSIEDHTIAIKRAASPLKSINYVAEEVLAPPVNLRGKILDENREPVVGATITVKGTRKATASDAEGNFELRGVDENATVVVSGINIETNEMTINGRNNLSIVVKKKIVEDEAITVVSTGYQRLPLERATGSYTHITAAQLDKSNSFNLKDRLEGMVPGMFFETQYDEDQNANSERTRSIVLRGVGTYGSTDPLIVVDGAPFYTGGLDPWTLINPADVESITVLKDAAAASIWGSQAANGVIVITTKTGGLKKGQPLLNASIDYLVQPVPKLSKIPWASSKDAIDIYKNLILDRTYLDALMDPASAAVYELPEVVKVLVDMKKGTLSQQDGNAKLEELSKLDVRDEFKDLFFRKMETNKKINLSFQGGSNVNKVRTSLTGLLNNMYSKGNSDMQVIVNIVDEYTPKNWIKFSFGSNVVFSEKKDNGVLVNELANMPQMSRILGDDGSYLPMVKNNSEDTYYDVPYQRRRDSAAKYKLPYDWDWNLKRDFDNTDKSTKLTNIRLYTNMQVKLFKGFTAELYYQFQKDHSIRSEYYNENTWQVRNNVNNNARKDGKLPVPPGGMLYENQMNGYSHNARLNLNYQKTIGNHAISILGGGEIRQNYLERIPYGYYGYDPQALTNVTTIRFDTTITPKMNGDDAAFGQTTIPLVPTQRFGVTISGAEDRYVSAYGNVGYTFKNRYDITGSIRLDKTNLYGQSPKNSNLPQWSAGIGWQFSDEEFFKFDFVDRMKLRASYGFNGNIRKGVSPYLLGYPWVDPLLNIPYAAVQSAPNPGLTWEKTQVYNIGLDYSFFKGRINGSIEVYQKTATDVLAQIAVNGTYGYQNNRAELNTGSIRNRGLEISVNARIIDLRSVKWQTRFNYSTNKNRAYDITQVNKGAIAYTTLWYYYHLPNQPVDFMAAAEWMGYDENGLDKFMYQGKESKVTDFPNSSLINYGDLFKVVGQRNPKHFGQWANTVSWKGIELNISMVYKLGHKFVGDYPPTGLKNNYFTASRYYTWFPELMVNSWKSAADGNNASMFAFYDILPGTTAQKTSYQSVLDNVARYNTRNVMDASSLRLQSLALGYFLPAKISGPFKNVRIQLEARNLGTLWVANEQGVDPDFPAYSSSVYGALQYVTRNRAQYSASVRFGF